MGLRGTRGAALSHRSLDRRTATRHRPLPAAASDLARARETAKIILAYRGQPELEIAEVLEGIRGGSRGQRVDVDTDDDGKKVRFLVRAANLTACDLSEPGIHLTNMEQTAQRIAETLK